MPPRATFLSCEIETTTHQFFLILWKKTLHKLFPSVIAFNYHKV